MAGAALSQLFGRDVHRRLPVQAFEPGRVGAVERLDARPAEHAQVERVSGRARRGAVECEVEALEAELLVETERRRDACTELFHQVGLELARRGEPEHEGAELRRTKRREARQPVDASGRAEVALTGAPLLVHVLAEPLGRGLGKQPLRLALTAAGSRPGDRRQAAATVATSARAVSFPSSRFISTSQSRSSRGIRKFRRTNSFPRSARWRATRGSARISRQACAASSRDSTSQPGSPSWICATIPPARLATTGRVFHSASVTVRPKPSRVDFWITAAECTWKAFTSTEPMLLRFERM